MKREGLKVKEKYKSELNFIKLSAGSLMGKNQGGGLKLKILDGKKGRPNCNTSCSLRLIH